MKAAIISLGSVSSKWTAKAMKKYFDDVDELYLKDIEVNLGEEKLEALYNGKPLKEYDCIYVKGSFRYLSLLQSITTALYNQTPYMPLNPEAFTLGHDKILTQLAIQLNNIPSPGTYLASSAEAAKKILKKINYPIIMKFPHGTQGKGVMFADSYASASSMLDALAALKQPFLIQEYVETGGVDVRAIVVGNKVVAAMKRKAVPEEKRANIHAGAIGESCKLDYHTKKLAVEAAKAIGADVCAVDILESVKGPVVIEINLSPGLQGITKATKIDVADEIAKQLYKNTKKTIEGQKHKKTGKILEDLGIEKTEKVNEIITTLDIRGDRILLPEAVTKITKLDEKEEVIITSDKGKINIRKMDVK